MALSSRALLTWWRLLLLVPVGCSTTNVTNIYESGPEAGPLDGAAIDAAREAAHDSASGPTPDASAAEAAGLDAGSANGDSSTQADAVADATPDAVALVCCMLPLGIQTSCWQDYDASAPSEGTAGVIGTVAWQCSADNGATYTVPCGQCVVGEKCEGTWGADASVNGTAASCP